MPWLMKAEPDSRIVKGKDVKFSVDDFEAMGVSPWDGVRSHEAKLIMKEKMKLGDKILFYHSNTKVPGVFAIAEVEKEGYPDYTAWDESHPYYDPKSSEENPTWYMVSVKFIRRLKYPVTLAFVKGLVGKTEVPEGIEYIGKEGLKAIQSMALINRGRLSVQPVEQAAFEAIVKLGDQGGFDDGVKVKTKKAKKEKEDEDEDDRNEKANKGQAKKEEVNGDVNGEKDTARPAKKAKTTPKAKVEPAERPAGTRRSTRLEKSK